MNLIKTSFLTAISTGIRIITGFIVNKIVAVYIGPAGIALVGQFQNFSSIIMSFATGAINSGVTKYTAQYYDDKEKKAKMLSTALMISVICSFIVSIVLIFANKYLSIHLLKSEKYSSIFVIFGITLIVYALNSLFISILNGHKEIRKFVTVNIVTSIVSLIFTGGLVVFLGLYGALLSCVTAQTVVFIVTIFFVVKSDWFSVDNFIKGVDKENLIKLGKYSLMAITTALTVPVSQIFVRNYIADTISLDAAGYWQGIWKISEVYLTIITTSLGVYYLPRLSEITDDKELRKEIFSGYKILLPIVAVIAIFIYFIKVPLIHILFTDKFMPMIPLFKYQLLGDFIKMASWILGFLLLAKAMTRWFIATEIIFTLTFVILSKVLIDKFGIVGVTQAFAINYFIHLIFMIWLFRNLIFVRGKNDEDGN